MSLLTGKVAFITGGARGIGPSIARLFLQQDAQVIIADGPNNFHQSLRKELPDATFVPWNVTSDSDVKKAFEEAIRKYKKLDIMVINSSTPDNPDPKILGTKDEEFGRALTEILHVAFLSAKHAADVMIRAKKGVILFTSGDALLTTEVCPYAYAMSKHALVGLAYNLSAELGKQNIRVSYISPPSTIAALSPADKEKKAAPVGTIGARGNLKEVVVEAKEVADAALNLSSDVPAAVLEHGGSSKTNQPSKKKQRPTIPDRRGLSSKDRLA